MTRQVKWVSGDLIPQTHSPEVPGVVALTDTWGLHRPEEGSAFLDTWLFVCSRPSVSSGLGAQGWESQTQLDFLGNTCQHARPWTTAQLRDFGALPCE